jgi:hypothetical protein
MRQDHALASGHARRPGAGATTPLGSFTLADNQKLITFQKVKCGIKFAAS